MNETRQSDAAKNFANEWNGRGDEERDYQTFWFTMLRDVFNIERPERLIEFQKPVAGGKHIDAYIAKTKVLIEHKSFGVSLDQKIRQSDGEYLTPFEQAMRYADALPASERPRRIITCNFNEFHIYDLQQMDSLIYLTGEKIYMPLVLKLENFRNDFASLKFIVDPNAEVKPEVKISIDAAKIVRKICAAIDEHYADRDDDYIDALSKLCARLVFCFYADDEKLFTKTKFGDYLATLKNLSPEQFRDAIQKFFDVLNTDERLRPENLSDALKNFPCVDGGLFEEKIPIPPLGKDFQFAVKRAHIFDDLRMDEFNEFVKFSWREIEPPIFGAMFESLFNPETRRSEGIHYTTVENIHKVIDPLFLDDLTVEFAEIKRMRKKNRADALRKFQAKLASLNFLDPACGSGNFLTETYLSLRKLENEVLKELRDLYAYIPDNPIKVTPRQFYGIEINDFAVAVAKDALWIAEIQMLRKTAWIINRKLKELPLRKYISIRKANALQIDWKAVVAPDNIDYIIGNPPFVGGMRTSAEQNSDLRRVWGNTRGVGEMDYVSGWYKKAADFMCGKQIRTAFLSTNSIAQGQQACTVWKPLLGAGNHIDFAYQTFKWLNESHTDYMAHVHCVIIGFSNAPNAKPKKIFDGGKKPRLVANINQYLLNAPTLFIESRSAPVCPVPPMRFGSMPRDGGGLIIRANDLETFLRLEPEAEKYIRLYLGADEFIKCKKRYCLWFDGVPLDEIKNLPLCWERVEAVKTFRLASVADATKNFAKTSHLFCQIAQPTTNYILVPRVSSERRRYIPMGFMPPSVIASDAAQVIPAATLYHFGVLTSSIHMAWTRTTAGRLKSDYRYSKDVVYNNFPWPEPTPSQRRAIERTAQEILDVRAGFDGWTFAALYNPETMPQPLHDAHKLNDTAVALAYGFESILHDEAAVVAELMKLYRRLTS